MRKGAAANAVIVTENHLVIAYRYRVNAQKFLSFVYVCMRKQLNRI